MTAGDHLEVLPTAEKALGYTHDEQRTQKEEE